jgi:hypothetical protein
MLSDGLDLIVMKKKINLIYFALAGWLGVILALLMPIAIFSTTEDIYRDPLFFPLWIIGSTLSLLTGICMLIYQGKKVLNKLGFFFAVVGLLSLAGAACDYFQNDTSSKPPLVGQPANPGTTGN